MIKVRDYDEALDVASASRFALTAGVFSRSPVNIEKARRKLRVGNLYINRGCTGATVERHPFGGFGLSGLGTKAGGTEYLQEFMVMRVLTENTLARVLPRHPDGTTRPGDFHIKARELPASFPIAPITLRA